MFHSSGTVLVLVARTGNISVSTRLQSVIHLFAADGFNQRGSYRLNPQLARMFDALNKKNVFYADVCLCHPIRRVQLYYNSKLIKCTQNRYLLQICLHIYRGTPYLEIFFHIVLRLRMHGSIPPFPNTSSCRGA